jgi:hypothetical protein
MANAGYWIDGGRLMRARHARRRIEDHPAGDPIEGPAKAAVPVGQ